MDVSIVIVSYNTRELTIQTIESVFRSQTRYAYEIIVVDNHSSDGSVEALQSRFPEVRIIANNENVGFSRANNQGIRLAKGRYVLLLNSDTIVNEGTLETMIRFMDEHPHVGASGCKVVLPNGSLDKACRRGFPTPSASFYYAFGIAKMFPKCPRFNQYQLTHLDPDQDYPVDCLVGAFMLVRREAIEQVGLLDEDYFMYGEDVDWCYRIKQAGWEIYYYPYTQIVHYKGASSRKKSLKIVYEFHRAMILFYRKHYVSRYPWIVNAAVYAGVTIKFCMAVMRNSVVRWR